MNMAKPIDTARTCRDVDVWSIDADVLVSHDHIRGFHVSLSEMDHLLLYGFSEVVSEFCADQFVER